MYADMSFEEKVTWIYALATVFSFGIYLALILGRAKGGPLHEVAYVAPMLWMIGGAIVAIIAGCIAVASIWPKECGKKDIRDLEIGRFGEYVGQSFLAMGGMAALGMSMARVDHFWIANVIYLSFVLSSILGSIAKLVAYRRGFQSC